MGRPRKLNGYALMMAIGLIGILFVLGLALVYFMTAQRSLLRKAEDTSLAREASRAGVDFALAQLRRDPETGKATYSPEAQAYLTKAYRKGWDLLGASA